MLKQGRVFYNFRDFLLRRVVVLIICCLIVPCMIFGFTACSFSETRINMADSSAGEGLLKGTLVKGISFMPNVPSYDIKLELDLKNASYTGSEKVEYTNLSDTGLESIYFRLFPNSKKTYGNGSLDVFSVKTDGSDTFTLLSVEDSVLEVMLPEKLDPGENITLSLDFKGKVPVDFSGGGYGIFNYTKNIMTLAGWFPILAVYDENGWSIDPASDIGDSVYSETSNYSVAITVQSGLSFATTGILRNIEKSADNRTVYSFEAGLVRDFMIVASSEYKVLSQNIDEIRINAYYLPGSEKKARDTIKISSAAVDIFNNRFGDYPYTELDVIEDPLGRLIGVEFPNSVLINPSFFSDPIGISHEIAHQWWYGVVGNDVIADPWLDEALATYSSVIYFEEAESKQAAQNVLQYYEQEYQKIVDADADGSVSGDMAYFEDRDAEQYTVIVYFKGALFLDALRKDIGDEAFFNALQDYYQNKKFQIAGPTDLLDSFEKASGKELDGLFQKWLY